MQDIKQQLQKVLSNPPTWTDENPKTQLERIMDIFSLAVEQERDNLTNKVKHKFNGFAGTLGFTQNELLDLINNK